MKVETDHKDTYENEAPFYEVTFRDSIPASSKEKAHELLLKHLAEYVANGDLSEFTFQKLKS